MKLHNLKILENYYKDLFNGKTFELRKNDRDYQAGDLINFEVIHDNNFSLKQNAIFKITYVLKNVEKYGLDKDYCILGIKELK